MTQINEFQRECIEEVLKTLKSKGLPPCQFKHVAGRSEQYQVAPVTVGGQLYEIYVYEDEAGLKSKRGWFICEKPDFHSSQDLIHAFSKLLEEKLTLG